MRQLILDDNLVDERGVYVPSKGIRLKYMYSLDIDLTKSTREKGDANDKF